MQQRRRFSRAHALIVALVFTACQGPREEVSSQTSGSTTDPANSGSGQLTAPEPSSVARVPKELPRLPLTTAAPAAERLTADVAWLADDAREGRRAGTAGEEASASWIAARFDELGLIPAGDNGWFQSFEVPLPVRPGESSEVKWIGVGDNGILSGKRSVAPLFCSASGEASGRLVYAGYGIVNEERGWNDYEELNVKGAVVVFLRGAPEVEAVAVDTEEEAVEAEDNPHGSAPAHSGWGSSSTIFHKVMEAKRRGVVGVIMLPRTPEEELLGFDASRTAESGIPAVTISWEVYEEMRGANEVEMRADVVRERGTARNVLARLAGEDSSESVVLGAHFDHLGRGGLGSLARDGGGAIHNGADDNASGTAVVLEVARCLSEGVTPPCDVVFALWSGEELGLLGSEYWGQNPTVDLDGVLLNLNFDMVGRAGKGTLQVLGAGTSEDFVPWLQRAGDASGLSLAISSSGQGIGGSDHQTFLKREIPALHFFSGVHMDYHRPSDDLVGFEAAGAEQVAELSLEFLAHVMGDVAGGGDIVYVKPAPSEGENQTQGGFRTRFGSVPEYSYEGPGVLLAGTSPGGPAERGGLIKDDLILKIGDIEIGTVHDLMFALNVHKPGDVVLVKYQREGGDREVRLTLDSPDLE